MRKQTWHTLVHWSVKIQTGNTSAFGAISRLLDLLRHLAISNGGRAWALRYANPLIKLDRWIE